MTPTSLDRPIGDDLSPLGELLGADATDLLGGLEAMEQLAQMRELEPDALALIELAPVLGCSRATLPNRLTAARARLRAAA